MKKEERQKRQDAVVAICATPKSYSDICRELGFVIDHRTIRNMVTTGKLYAVGMQPSLRYLNHIPTNRERMDQIQTKNGKLNADATVTWPEHVKVQVCPPYEDNRFKFVPPSKNWTGQITADRRELGMCK